MFSEAILESWRGSELVSIDPWLADAADQYVDDSNVPQQDQERNFAETKNRLGRFGDRSTIWRMTSVEAAATLEDRSLDFVYLDRAMTSSRSLKTWPRGSRSYARVDCSPGTITTTVSIRTASTASGRLSTPSRRAKA